MRQFIGLGTVAVGPEQRAVVRALGGVGARLYPDVALTAASKA